jgi:hypothetical protein
MSNSQLQADMGGGKGDGAHALGSQQLSGSAVMPGVPLTPSVEGAAQSDDLVQYASQEDMFHQSSNALLKQGADAYDDNMQEPELSVPIFSVAVNTMAPVGTTERTTSPGLHTGGQSQIDGVQDSEFELALSEPIKLDVGNVSEEEVVQPLGFRALELGVLVQQHGNSVCTSIPRRPLSLPAETPAFMYTHGRKA